MRVQDVIMFSPKYHIGTIDFNSKEILIDAFADRIKEYYIKPAQLLNDSGAAFGAGVLLLSTVEAIGVFSVKSKAVKTKFDHFSKQISSVSDQGEAHLKVFMEKLWIDFRNGLVHEGRIKSGSQFCYDYPFLEIIDRDCLIINPEVLYTEVESYFHRQLQAITVQEGVYSHFVSQFKRLFKSEIERLR